mmetsp:Transcript_22866/g.58479  ORF Transcript_22866/g.58479 Transcript_22866/m.58479 type:complete len:597 (+) Transcript_22866:61-1851(+)
MSGVAAFSITDAEVNQQFSPAVLEVLEAAAAFAAATFAAAEALAPSSEGAAQGLVAAGQAAASAAGASAPSVGARHVAYVMFCQHPLGPRLAWATCTTDVPGLRQDLQLYASLSAAEAHRRGVPDEPGLLVEAARARSTRKKSQAGGGEGPGADPGLVDLGDLLLSLFEPLLQLAPVLERSGLRLADAERQMPKALRALNLYEAQATLLGSSSPPPAAGRAPSGGGRRGAAAVPPGLSEAMRSATARLRDLQGAEEPRRPSPSPRPAAQPFAPNSGLATNPWAHGEVEAEMAELAPRSARRASEVRLVLSSCGTDLVERAREGRLDPVIGRDPEITRVLQILARRTKNNVALVGAPGVGKTAVAEAIAQRIAEGRVPPQLKGCKELWSLDIGALLAGTGLRGDFEERLRDLLLEVKSSQGAVILFIDELHLVLGAGRSENNNVDAANLMKPMLARGEIRCIGATTSAEYHQLILKKDAAFERRFQVVELREPSEAVSAEMLRGLLPLYAKHHALDVPPSLAEVAVSASVRCIQGRSLPDKAIDVLDEACCFASDAGAKEVTAEHVQAVASRWRPSPGRALPFWMPRWAAGWLPGRL